MTPEEKKKKKKKKDQSFLEKELFQMLQVALRQTLDKALDEVLKDFK